jgi:hypothetical protein
MPLCANSRTEQPLHQIETEVGGGVQAARIRDRVFVSVEVDQDQLSAGELADMVLKAAQRCDYHAADLAVP